MTLYTKILFGVAFWGEVVSRLNLLFENIIFKFFTAIIGGNGSFDIAEDVSAFFVLVSVHAKIALGIFDFGINHGIFPPRLVFSLSF